LELIIKVTIGAEEQQQLDDYSESNPSRLSQKFLDDLLEVFDMQQEIGLISKPILVQFCWNAANFLETLFLPPARQMDEVTERTSVILAWRVLQVL